MAILVTEGSQRLDYRLNTLKYFATSVTNVISAATACGSAFQHEVERERSSFDAFLESSPWDDADFCDGLQSFFRSMERSGQAFAALAASLTFHTAQPLVHLSKELTHIREHVISQKNLHDKQLNDCKSALTAAKDKKIQMTAQLNNWERERKQYDEKKDRRMMSMFTKKTTSRLDRKLRAAIAGQHAAMEEVAARAQAAELAQKELENTYTKLFLTLQKSEARLCHMVVTSLTAVAGAVEENVEAMREAAAYACQGAQSIQRVHSMEEETTNAYNAQSASEGYYALNPFADDGLIIPPGGRPVQLRSLKTAQAAREEDSSDGNSESMFSLTMVSRISEEATASTWTCDLAPNSRLGNTARVTRGWWNDVEMCSPVVEGVASSSGTGKETLVRILEAGANNRSATSSFSAASSEYTSASLTPPDVHGASVDKAVKPAVMTAPCLRDTTVLSDSDAENLTPVDVGVRDNARIQSTMSDALTDREVTEQSVHNGSEALAAESITHVNLTAGVELADEVELADGLTDTEDEDKLIQLVENTDFAE